LTSRDLKRTKVSTSCKNDRGEDLSEIQPCTQLLAQSFHSKIKKGVHEKIMSDREKEGLRGKEENKAREAYETEVNGKKRCTRTRVEINVSLGAENIEKAAFGDTQEWAFIDLDEAADRVNTRSGACQNVKIPPYCGVQCYGDSGE
jgi:hypothetical protein